ncbi:MAG TPA: hypothetical protein VKZ65_16850 [Glycomyces sp.]|nr:hypothetical protein [Glycomyces sp.]
MSEEERTTSKVTDGRARAGDEEAVARIEPVKLSFRGGTKSALGRPACS